MKRKILIGLTCMMFAVSIAGCSNGVAEQKENIVSNESAENVESGKMEEAESDNSESDKSSESDEVKEQYDDYIQSGIGVIVNDYESNQMRAEKQYINMKLCYEGRLESIYSDYIVISDVNNDRLNVYAHFDEDDTEICDKIIKLNNGEMVKVYGTISSVDYISVSILLEHVAAKDSELEQRNSIGNADSYQDLDDSSGVIEDYCMYKEPIDILELTGEYLPMDTMYCLYVFAADDTDDKSVVGKAYIEIPQVDIMCDANLIKLGENTYQLAYPDMDPDYPLILSFLPDDESECGYGAILFRGGEYFDTFLMSAHYKQ